MPPTQTHGKLEAIRTVLAKCAAEFASSGLPLLANVTNDILTAIEYGDLALIRSQVNTAMEEYREVIERQIDKRLGCTKLICEGWNQVRKELIGHPCEDLDDAGKLTADMFDQILANLTELRDQTVRLLQRHDFVVKNASLLNAEIEELSKLKASVMSAWPWTSRMLPPVDRKMVAESRKSIAQGKGISKDDVLRSFGGEAMPAD
jgi:hypothetical protein